MMIARKLVQTSFFVFSLLWVYNKQGIDHVTRKHQLSIEVNFPLGC